MTKIKIVTNGKLDKVGLQKVGKSFLLTLGAAAIGFIGNLTGVIDFGSSETLIATMLPFITNFLMKWLGRYEVIDK